MFQLWKLVLLCGLLTGTSASLLESLGSDVDDVVNDLQSPLEKETETVGNVLDDVVNDLQSPLEKESETVDNALDGVLQKVKDDLQALQKSEAWQLAEKKFQEAEKWVDNAVSKILPTVGGSLGLKISDTNIQDLKAELTSDGEGVTLTVTVTASVSLSLPLIGHVADLEASLDLPISVKIEIDTQTGRSTVVLGDCTSDQASISLTLLDSHSELITKAVDALNSFLSKTVSLLVQKEVCSLIHTFLHNLDADSFQSLVQNLQKNVDELQQGVQLPIDV